MLARQVMIMSSTDIEIWRRAFTSKICLVLWEEIAQTVLSEPLRGRPLRGLDILRFPMEHHPPILKALLQYRESDMLREGFHLLEALSTFESCACSDPKDQVYGLLGIVRPEERIRIDYRLDIEDVWQNAFTIVVQSQEKGLDDAMIDFLALKLNLHSHLDFEAVQRIVQSAQSRQWTQDTTTSSQTSAQASSVPRITISKD